ncbi:MAG: hypothetical protein Tp158DCM1229571_44 [Prokaryotic dsDNA virus sp.]|nr:MAG: hypothetical protein Tp158DCM1229571_44 [Prokaryotic dsDNA virus sp.]|tara:strand:- start:47730 stop:48047 length:318 start_codon:yes stop_codon:yes gene_type:complete
MLSTEYRLRLEFICSKIAKGEEVKLEDMIWADKLAKANRSAGEIMRRARRLVNNPEMKQSSLEGFMNALDLGDPDPNNHKKGFDSVDDMVQWFSQDKTDDWRQRD